MGGALVATPLCFKQSSICVSVVNQVGLLFGFCSFVFVRAVSLFGLLKTKMVSCSSSILFVLSLCNSGNGSLQNII